MSSAFLRGFERYVAVGGWFQGVWEDNRLAASPLTVRTIRNTPKIVNLKTLNAKLLFLNEVPALVGRKGRNKSIQWSLCFSS